MALYASCLLAVRVWYVLQPSSRFSDANVYLAMGRGILNGLIPYTQLFEIKPPGMFYMSAASLLIFGNAMLGNYLAAALIVVIPLAATLTICRCSRIRSSVAALSAYSGSVVLIVYTSIQSLPWQTELFGSLVGMIYVLTIARQPMTRTRMFAASLAILCCVGLKEPFVLSLLAAALILSATKKSFIQSFVIPASISGAVGLVSLWALGLLGPYATTYLATLAHYSGASKIPLLERGLLLGPFFAQWMAYSPLLPLNIAAWASIPIYLALGEHKTMRRLVYGSAKIAAVAYLTLLSAGIAGTFFAHHFGFPIPAYFALFIRCMQSLQARADRRHSKIFNVALTVLSVCTIATSAIFTDAGPTNTTSWNGLVESVHSAERQELNVRNIASEIDRAMDRCHIDRYFLLHTKIATLFGYTQHSPLNNYLFATFPYEYLTSPLFADSTYDRMRESSLIVSDTRRIVLPASPEGARLQQLLLTDFTMTPWPCAGNTHTEPYALIFRKLDNSKANAPVLAFEKPFEDYIALLPELTALADYQFDELRYAIHKKLELKFPFQDLHLAVVTDPELTVYIYNLNSQKFKTKVLFNFSKKLIVSVEQRARGYAPPFQRARKR